MYTSSLSPRSFTYICRKCESLITCLTFIHKYLPNSLASLNEATDTSWSLACIQQLAFSGTYMYTCTWQLQKVYVYVDKSLPFPYFVQYRVSHMHLDTKLRLSQRSWYERLQCPVFLHINIRCSERVNVHAQTYM